MAFDLFLQNFTCFVLVHARYARYFLFFQKKIDQFTRYLIIVILQVCIQINIDNNFLILIRSARATKNEGALKKKKRKGKERRKIRVLDNFFFNFISS